jgi:hypothetical protein
MAMTVEDIRAVLAEHRTKLAELGVSRLQVFGSVARGEAGPESDVDLLVDLRSDLDLFDFIDVKLYLEAALGCRVDLVEAAALKPWVRERALAEARDAA